MELEQILKHLKLDLESNIPLVAQLSEQITWLIASGDLRDGDQLPPIRDLAEALGIHMHTARMAYQRLEADDLVSIRTRRGTLVLPYNPESVAARGAGSSSYLLGVILPNPVSFYSPFIKKIQETARDFRYLPLFCYSYENPYLAETFFNQLIARQVDGFIITSLSLPSLLEKPALLEKYPPIVTVDMPDMPGYKVLIDTENAAYQSTKHLLDHGHRRIGLITPPLEWPNVMPFFQGFERALAEVGLRPDTELTAVVPGFEDPAGREGANQLLDLDLPPEAIVAAADLLALGAIQAIRGRGLDIPQDIALVGYNDIDAAALVQPGLTTVSVSTAEMGSLAMETLMKMIDGKTPRRKIQTIPTTLVIRGSCGC
jgi:LacI family transcriptional regulator